jgi:hypothetical protein
MTPAVKEATEEASRLCSEGDDGSAVDRLVEAAQTDPNAAASATVDLLSGTEIMGKVVVDSDRGSVSLLVYPEALGSARAMAVLEPSQAGGPVQRVFLEPVEEADYLLAEFEDVSDGAFTLGVEVL